MAQMLTPINLDFNQNQDIYVNDNDLFELRQSQSSIGRMFRKTKKNRNKNKKVSFNELTNIKYIDTVKPKKRASCYDILAKFNMTDHNVNDASHNDFDKSQLGRTNFLRSSKRGFKTTKSKNRSRSSIASSKQQSFQSSQNSSSDDSDDEVAVSHWVLPHDSVNNPELSKSLLNRIFPRDNFISKDEKINNQKKKSESNLITERELQSHLGIINNNPLTVRQDQKSISEIQFLNYSKELLTHHFPQTPKNILLQPRRQSLLQQNSNMVQPIPLPNNNLNNTSKFNLHLKDNYNNNKSMNKSSYHEIKKNKTAKVNNNELGSERNKSQSSFHTHNPTPDSYKKLYSHPSGPDHFQLDACRTNNQRPTLPTEHLRQGDLIVERRRHFYQSPLMKSRTIIKNIQKKSVYEQKMKLDPFNTIAKKVNKEIDRSAGLSNNRKLMARITLIHTILTFCSLLLMIIDNEVEWNSEYTHLPEKTYIGLQILRILNLIVCIFCLFAVFLKLFVENRIFILNYSSAPGNKKFSWSEVLYYVFECSVIFILIPPFIDKVFDFETYYFGFKRYITVISFMKIYVLIIRISHYSPFQKQKASFLK
jgi:hypothetical protein